MKALRILIPAVVILTGLFCSTTEKPQSSSGTTVAAPEVKGTAYLGIQYIKVRDGVRVVEVFPGSPAEKVGLALGDLILSTDGYPILGTFTLRERILSLKPGDTITLEIEKRDGRRRLKKAVLARLPAGFSNPDE